MRTIVGLVLLWSVEAQGTATEPTPCPLPGRDYVRLIVNGEEPASGCSATNSAVVTRISNLIRADLATRALDVCADLPAGLTPPLATVVISGPCTEQPTVRISVVDGATEKEFTRRLPLAGLPEDAHALAVAVGAVELLRASWDEPSSLVARHANGQRSGDGSPENESGFAQKRGRGQLSSTVGIVGEAFSGGLRQAGLDAELALSVGPQWDLLARFGGRGAKSVTSTHGRVDAESWVLGVGMSALVLRPSPSVQLRLTFRLDGAWVAFSPSARGKAIASPEGGISAWSSLGLSNGVRLVDNAWFYTDVIGGWVVLPVVATDKGMAVLGAEGAFVSGRISVKVLF